MGRTVFTLLVAAFFFYVASPLLLPVVMGGLFAVLLLPLQEKLEQRRIPSRLAALFLTLGITLVLLIPTTVSLYLAAKLAFQQVQLFKDSPALPHGDLSYAITHLPGMRTVLLRINEWYPIGAEELSIAIQDFLRSASIRAADLLGGLAAQLPGMVMSLGVIIVSIYFLLVDGRRLILDLRYNSIFPPSQTDRLINTLEATCRSVLLASIVSGAAQALFETVVVTGLGLSNLVLIGVVVFLSSFVPVIGTAPVTLGLALQQFVVGNRGGGLILLISAAIVTTMDNLIRPWFLQGSVNLHPLLAFVAAFGGLQTLGFVGVFLGPILAALFVATLQILPSRSSPHSRTPESGV